jgi:hypothetical protein
LLSLHFLFRYMAGPSPGDLSARTPLVRAEGEAGAGSTILLAGLAAGLAFGMKRTGLVYCSVAVIALGVNLALRRRGGLLSWGGLTARLAVFLIPLVVVGSYWYARNWVHYGNPVYPSHVHLLGHEVFGNPPAPGAIYLGEAGPQPSLIQSLLGQHVVEGSQEMGAIHVGEASAQPWFVHTSLSWWHDVAPWTHPEDYYRADQRSGGLGAPYTLLELPALLALAIVSLRRDRRLLNLLVPVAVMFLIQPDKWWSRHTLILAALGAVALLYVAERWAHRWAGRAIRVAIFPALAITLWFSTAAFELGGGFENTGPPLFWAPKVVTLIRNTDARSLDRVLHMPAYGFLPGVPPGSGIGVDTSATFFYSPFYGSYYSNRVYALSEPSAPTLPETVFVNRIRYLFLRRGSSLDRRARADLPGLRTLFEDRYVRVYRLG